MAATNPRKTPRQARAAVTVDAILDATAHILREGGLAGLTTNAIAERAGVSIGSLYQYFPGKEALLCALIRRKRAGMLLALRSVTTGAMSLEQAVEAFIAEGIAHQAGDPALSLALTYAEQTLPIQPETAALKAAIIAEVSVMLAQHGIEDPDVAARDIVALSRGMADHAGLYGERFETSLLRRIKRAVLGYLATE